MTSSIIVKTRSRLTLVGSGPGDPDLITVKGLKAIREADVILYDALVSSELLKEAKPESQLIFVGKRSGKHYSSQDEIHRLIAQYCFQYPNVIRLKGGDPFVFARGHEELEFAEALGIVVDVIPGLSSSYALTSLQKIPLTKRGRNESFWVTTGTTRNGRLSRDIFKAAETNATVVILMGMKKTREIEKIYTTLGKGKTPFAVIQNGSTPNEKILTGRVDQLHTEVIHKGFSSPAIIVIGEVVLEHKNLRETLLNEYYFSSKKALN